MNGLSYMYTTKIEPQQNIVILHYTDETSTALRKIRE